jgi:hypothetical protein
VASAPEGDAEAVGDIAEGELFEAYELERPPLALGQLFESGAEDPPALLTREQRLRRVGALAASFELFDRLSAIGGPALQIGFAAQGAVIGVLEQPALDAAAFGLVEMRLSRNLEEDFLGDVLGFGRVAQDVGGDAVHESRVSAQQGVDGVAVGSRQGGDQFRVAFRQRGAGAGRMTRCHGDAHGPVPR